MVGNFREIVGCLSVKPLNYSMNVVNVFTLVS